jgi:hypothetical protein
VPRSLLPPLATGESEDDRKNVKFDSRFGGVDASISLLGDAQDPSVDEARLKKRTSLDVKSEHGSIKLRLVRPTFSTILNATYIKCGIAHLLVRNRSSIAIPSECDGLPWLGQCGTSTHIPRSYDDPFKPWERQIFRRRFGTHGPL